VAEPCSALAARICWPHTKHRGLGATLLFKHGHLEKQLRAQGRSATAEIVSIKTEGQGNSMRAMFADDSDLTTTWFLCRLDLRITPPGEPAFEARVHTRLNTLKSAGDTVAVLYDPNDHGKVVVDYQSDAKAAMDSAAELQRLTRDLDKDDDAASAASAGGAALDPELQQLMDSEEAERSGATAPSPGASAAPAADARIDHLQELADLHDRGVLTDAEFAEEKARILKGP
jgi:hypothetical protein